MKNVIWVEFSKLREFMIQVLQYYKVNQEDSNIIANVLIAADKQGIDSHGIGRFKPIYIDRIEQGILNFETKLDIVKDNMATAIIDANNGFGHVAGVKAMQLAIEKAKTYGMGMVSVKNSSHYGIAGYYTQMAADEGMIGITGTNARPSMAPTFGVENMLGTNPLTFGIPTDESFDFILDCATSTTQRGKIEKYARDGLIMPRGWVVDNEGNSSTDPEMVLKELNQGLAALTPLGGLGEELGGYKGYGYGTVVEILSSALHLGPFMNMLTGLNSAGEPTPYRLGHFFIAINVGNFIELDLFKKHTGDILRELRASKKAPGEDRIYTAGEKEYLVSLERKSIGAPIGEVLQKQIQELSKRCNVERPY